MGKKKKYQKSVYQSMALITQFGITMLVPIFLCAFLGWYLDKTFHTAYLFVVLFFVGALAGFRNIYILARKIYEDEEDTQSYEALRRSLQKEASPDKGKKHSRRSSKKGERKDE